MYIELAMSAESTRKIHGEVRGELYYSALHHVSAPLKAEIEAAAPTDPGEEGYSDFGTWDGLEDCLEEWE